MKIDDGNTSLGGSCRSLMILEQTKAGTDLDGQQEVGIAHEVNLAGRVGRLILQRKGEGQALQRLPKARFRRGFLPPSSQRWG